MKISTLLIVFFCGLIAFAVFSGSRPAPTASHGVTTSSADRPTPVVTNHTAPINDSGPAAANPGPPPPSVSTPAPSLISSLRSWLHRSSPAPTPHVTWRRDELRIARGTVVERLDDALVIDCEPWYMPVHDPEVENRGDAPGLMPHNGAAMAYTHELETYGPLLNVANGRLQPSNIDPGVFDYHQYVRGLAYVYAIPVTLMGPGKPVKIVVAPEDNTSWHGKVIPAFKASFVLEGGEAPGRGDWMWDTRGRTGLTQGR